MNAVLRYKTIQSFKRSKRGVLDDINYANVIATYLYDMSFIGWLKKLTFSLFFVTRIAEFHHTGSKLLIFYSCRYKKRADCDFIVNRLREIAGAEGDYAESVEKLCLVQGFYTLARLPQAWRATRGYHVGLQHRFGAALLVAKYLSTVNRTLMPLLHGRLHLVTFCDAMPIENLMTQLASIRGIATSTNQHGQYRVLGDNNMSPDAEAYANFVSDRMLCWGQATCTEFVRFGFKPDRFVIVGWIRQQNEPAKCDQRPSVATGIFGVMLNGENGKESNISMIKAANIISEELDMKYIIRLHPMNNPNDYKGMVSDCCANILRFDISEYIDRVDFSIAHMTGAAIEMLAAGSPVYLLDDGKLADVFCKVGLSYKNEKSIIDAIKLNDSTYNYGRQHWINISRWYNDDSDQLKKIQHVILNKEN